MDIANAALTAAQGTVTVAQSSLDLANLALSAVEQTYRIGTMAANEIAKVGLNGLISIREITFDVSLSAANGGTFSGSVRASFVGQAEVSASATINLRDIAAIAKDLADNIGSGLSSLF